MCVCVCPSVHPDLPLHDCRPPSRSSMLSYRLLFHLATPIHPLQCVSVLFRPLQQHQYASEPPISPEQIPSQWINSKTTWLVQLHTLIHNNSTIQTIQFSHKDHTISRTRPIHPVVQVVDSKTIRATSAIHCCKNRFWLCAVVGGNCTYMIPLVYTKVDLNQQTIRRTINMQTKCVYKLTMPVRKWKATGTIDSLCLARPSIDFVLRSISLTS